MEWSCALLLLQSAYHDREHGGDGEASVGVVVPDEVASIPEQEGVAAEDGEIGGSQAHPLCEPCLVSDPLRYSQCRRVGLQCSRFSHIRENGPDLHQRLPFVSVSGRKSELELDRDFLFFLGRLPLKRKNRRKREREIEGKF